jgi:hypothetical protein
MGLHRTQTAVLSQHPEKPVPGAFLEQNQKMRFPDSFIFKGLLLLKMLAYPCTRLVSVLSGQKPLKVSEVLLRVVVGHVINIFINYDT